MDAKIPRYIGDDLVRTYGESELLGMVRRRIDTQVTKRLEEKSAGQGAGLIAHIELIDPCLANSVCRDMIDLDRPQLVVVVRGGRRQNGWFQRRIGKALDGRQLAYPGGCCVFWIELEPKAHAHTMG